jgi:excisionase family DNA binding protein
MLSTREVSQWLGISTRTVCFWVECQVIPAFRVGRHWRFERKAVLEWLRSRNPGTSVPDPPHASR